MLKTGDFPDNYPSQDFIPTWGGKKKSDIKEGKTKNLVNNTVTSNNRSAQKVSTYIITSVNMNDLKMKCLKTQSPSHKSSIVALKLI